MKTTRVTSNNFTEYICNKIYSVNVVNATYLQQARRKEFRKNLFMKIYEIPDHKDIIYEGENWENDVKGHKINGWSEKDDQYNLKKTNLI